MKTDQPTDRLTDGRDKAIFVVGVSLYTPMPGNVRMSNVWTRSYDMPVFFFTLILYILY